MIDKNGIERCDFAHAHEDIVRTVSYTHLDVYKRQAQEGLKARVVAPLVLDILPEAVSKASAIERMLGLLGFDRSQAIAFGDEENDLEMFGAVDYTVAMGNAIDALKQTATYVTDSVDEDGIYNACCHFGLI